MTDQSLFAMTDKSLIIYGGLTQRRRWGLERSTGNIWRDDGKGWKPETDTRKVPKRVLYDRTILAAKAKTASA